MSKRYYSLSEETYEIDSDTDRGLVTIVTDRAGLKELKRLIKQALKED